MPKTKIHPSTNVQLFVAIGRDRRPMYEIAALAGRSDAWLSRVVRGQREPHPEDKANLAEGLGVSVDDIVPGLKGQGNG